MGPLTQEDPIGIAGGLNLYGYANGDPVNFSDPFGLDACDPPDDPKCQSGTIVTFSLSAAAAAPLFGVSSKVPFRGSTVRGGPGVNAEMGIALNLSNGAHTSFVRAGTTAGSGAIAGVEFTIGRGSLADLESTSVVEAEFGGTVSANVSGNLGAGGFFDALGFAGGMNLSVGLFRGVNFTQFAKTFTPNHQRTSRQRFCSAAAVGLGPVCR